MFNFFVDFEEIYHIIFFFYGAAFIILAASIAAKDMKGSDLKLADSLWLLVMFGFTHGLHEWLQLYPLLEGANLSFRGIYLTKLIALALFVASYFFLFWFGFSLVKTVARKHLRLLHAVPVVVLVLWMFFLWHIGFSSDLRFLRLASIATRNTLGLTGGILTAYGLIAYSRELIPLSGTAARNLWFAGLSFAFYAVFAGVLGSNVRLPFPIEMPRGIAAIFITYFIIKALNIFDIETRRKIEQQARLIVQAEKLTSLGQLAAGIAHEINNPLTNASLGIQRAAAMLENGQNGDGRLLEKLHKVEKNIDRASAIARELLQFSRQRETAFIPVDVNALIAGALTLLQYKVKDVSVRQELAAGTEVMGDPGKLEQVFINILSNAVEAMPLGGSILIETARTGGRVQVRFTDTGSGIPEENLTRVFDPFFTTKETGTGTGLGLSICYGIIRDHDGSIELSSLPGRGTTVSISIPERKPHETHSRRR